MPHGLSGHLIQWCHPDAGALSHLSAAFEATPATSHHSGGRNATHVHVVARGRHLASFLRTSFEELIFSRRGLRFRMS